jgi:hypothetical protein
MTTVELSQFTMQRLFHCTDEQLHGLAELLIDCVDGGASVSFMHPLPLAKALDFWRGVNESAAAGARALLVAEDGDGVIGSVQLILGQPENQPHRADISKMLVHRRAPSRGRTGAAGAWAPHCCGRRRTSHSNAENGCWCWIPRVMMPSGCTRAWVGSGAA